MPRNGHPLRLKKYKNIAGELVLSPSGRTIIRRVVTQLTRRWYALREDDPEREDISTALKTLEVCYGQLHPEWRAKF